MFILLLGQLLPLHHCYQCCCGNTTNGCPIVLLHLQKNGYSYEGLSLELKPGTANGANKNWVLYRRGPAENEATLFAEIQMGHETTARYRRRGSAEDRLAFETA